uniref:Indolethylamine N-methyltransferase n=1 Tax=Nannospalax galili TaxID=1026970 RepID=A0A8C6S5I3_NANGA
MEGKLLTGGEDYEKVNPKDYLTTYYAFDSGTVAENKILKFNLEKLFQTFWKGGMGGDLLINIGSSPTVYQLLSAREAFQEIIATDYTSKDLQELQKWLNNDPGSPAMQYVCALEGDRHLQALHVTLLTVTHVLKCDLNKNPPLGSVQMLPADCVLRLLALYYACPNVDAYQEAPCSLASLLKPGEYLVTMNTLRFQHYMVGSKKFSGLYVEKEMVEKAMQDLWCDHHSLSYSETYCGNDGVCFVVACKGP